MKQKTLISVAHTGGQGKTTVAQLLYLLSKRKNLDYSMVSADYLDESGLSKLGKLYPKKVEEFGIGAILTAAREENNPNAPLRYWDRLGRIFLEGGAVLDVGANVMDNLITWTLDRNLARLMEKRNAPKVDFFLVCKAERHAIDNMSALLKTITKNDCFFIDKIYIVQNEVGGSFEKINMSNTLTSAVPNFELNYITMPRCYSEIWSQMERECMSIEHALASSEDDLCEELDVDLFTASAGVSELETWLDEMEAHFDSAGIFEAEVATASSTASGRKRSSK